MTEDQNPARKKDDWTEVDGLFRRLRESSEGSGEAEPSPQEILSPRADLGGIVKKEDEDTDIPSAPTLQGPDLSGSQDIMLRWKKRQINRKAALSGLQKQYDAQLDMLKTTLAGALRVHEGQTDQVVKSFFYKLDQKNMEMLAELGLRNLEARQKVLMQITEMTASKVQEAQGKNWPKDFIDDTLQQLWNLRMQTIAEIMKEPGQ